MLHHVENNFWAVQLVFFLIRKKKYAERGPEVLNCTYHSIIFFLSYFMLSRKEKKIEKDALQEAQLLILLLKFKNV